MHIRMSGSAQWMVWSTETSPWTSPGPYGLVGSNAGSWFTYWRVVGMKRRASTVTAGQNAGPRSLPVSQSDVS